MYWQTVERHPRSGAHFVRRRSWKQTFAFGNTSTGYGCDRQVTALPISELPERFGPIRVLPSPDGAIELPQQLLVQRDAEANKFLHDRDATIK